MTELYTASSSASPLTALLWCLYPIAVLVIIELLLGGGFDDDNNDDQDGGMLIPAYSRSNVWDLILISNLTAKKVYYMTTNVDNIHLSLIILTVLIIFSLSWLVLRTLREGRKALKKIYKDSP